MRYLFLLVLLSGNCYAATLYGNYDAINVGNYRVNNNVWNDIPGSQCIDVNTTTGAWSILSASHNKPTNGAPAAYPFTLVGCHWGACSLNNPLPKQVSALNMALGQWVATRPAAGIYNQSYDIWFNNTPTTNGQPNGQELMIWPYRRGPIQPIGVPVGNYNAGIFKFQVWHGGIVTSYVQTFPSTPINSINLKSFILDAQARGYINPAWYLISVEAGFEVWQGQPGIATNSFILTIN
jgi:cellulose 1,4-beta-cellobiosidase